MATINIDGKEYEFEGRPRLLQFCLDNGIEIPYFCYHPAMSAPTNCRMCLIDLGFHAKDRATGELQYDEEGNPKIMWGRKPATSCNTDMGPGMFVKTHRTSDMIKTAQQGVLEYMLVNHPLDCPICDQAGECPLQIWTYKYGPEGSRFEVQKSHKPKRIDLGPNVILDGERCINCTRCVRFTEEISKTDQLTIVGRGDKNLPSCAPGEVFDDPYSMNTIDICPVGALTSKQHRFKARVWEMASADGLDMNDSTGTNVTVWLRNNEVLRLTPRQNDDVNGHWMADAHRLNIDRYNKNRASGIKLKGDVPAEFEQGIPKAANLLAEHRGKTLFIGSAYASLESNYLFGRLANDLGADEVMYVNDTQEGSGDGWLIQDDKTPNAAGCELLGFKGQDIVSMRELMASGKYTAVYSLENGPLFAGMDAINATVLAHATHNDPAYEQVDVLLPAAIEIEGEGTYINNKGIPQVTPLARQIRQMSPEMWMRVPKSRLDKGAVLRDNWRDLEFVFDVLPSWQMVAMIGRELDIAMPYETHKDIFKKVSEVHYELLKDVHVSYKPPKSAFKSTQLDYAGSW
ncbi:MAG: 2Fe-2S iron-sulfur cluster-binding protein [Bacteroidia bacterium]